MTDSPVTILLAGSLQHATVAAAIPPPSLNFPRVEIKEINNRLFSTSSSFPRGQAVDKQIVWLLSEVGGADSR